MSFKTDYRLIQVKSIAECSKESILQYFRPSLSYHLSSRSLFCLLLIGRLRQVLLYLKMHKSAAKLFIVHYRALMTDSLTRLLRYTGCFVPLLYVWNKISFSCECAHLKTHFKTVCRVYLVQIWHFTCGVHSFYKNNRVR